MFRVAGGVADAPPLNEPTEHELPKQGSATEVEHRAVDKRPPKPPVVEDNMATCG
jgi:hypothetical protein